MRSENLVDLFHAAGHTIGMDMVWRIDTTIALDILARYEMNGNVYVPCEVVSYSWGCIVLASCDNIDVLEETIDGNNSFPCTEMLWQCGPSCERPDQDTKIGRARTLACGRMDKFHKLGHTYLPVKKTNTSPSPRP